tara:strand:+ start:344 stop:1219 length:876 start_codon:yes stop_codon:yes gene_type:complete
MKHDPYIKKFAFKDGLPQEFELVELGKLFKEHSDSLTIPHRTGFYHVLWFQKGTPTHMMDFETITIEPNTLLFLNKDTVQQFDKNEKIAGKALLFTESFFCRSVPDTKFLRSTILFNDLFSISKIKLPSDDSVVPSIIDHIRKELEKAKDDFQSTILHNLLHNLLLHCERERRKQDFTEIKQSVDLDIVMLFREELDIHYKHHKKVAYYANIIGVTAKRLNRATSRVLDKSPKSIIDDRVLLESKRLLAHTTSSVKEIGFELGFDEPTNFIKYFRKHLDLTPNDFRERNSL